MPPKNKSVYICSECGHESAKWYGQCPGCGEWNTMNEELRTAQASKSVSSSKSTSTLNVSTLSNISTDDEIR